MEPLTPLPSLRTTKYHIPAHALTPNTSLQNLPLLILHSVFPLTTTSQKISTHLTKIGIVHPQWTYTMYSTSHYHSTTHEVLTISHGRAKLCFGHEDNPDRVIEEVSKGDVVVIPAGVAHRLWEDVDGGFEMVGAYPKGCSWDMCYGKEGEEVRVGGIKELGWFEGDPVYGGRKGPVMDV